MKITEIRKDYKVRPLKTYAKNQITQKKLTNFQKYANY